jgi:hypothetical protein
MFVVVSFGKLAGSLSVIAQRDRSQMIKKGTYTKYVKYSNCRLDIEVCKTRQYHGDGEREVNLRARELGTLPNHFLYSIQKVSLRSDLSAGTDGKHASLFEVK